MTTTSPYIWLTWSVEIPVHILRYWLSKVLCESARVDDRCAAAPLLLNICPQ